MNTTTSSTTTAVQSWLIANPPPVRHVELSDWHAVVRSDLGPTAFPALLALLVGNNDETRLQAAAACQAYGVSVGAQPDDNRSWTVRLHGGESILVGAWSPVT